MAGIAKDSNGNWKVDPDFLTAERRELLERTDERRAKAKAARNPR